MCAAGVFLLHVSGVAWLFPNGCARTYPILLASGWNFGNVWEPGLQKELIEKKSCLRELKLQMLGAFSELTSEGIELFSH